MDSNETYLVSGKDYFDYVTADIALYSMLKELIFGIGELSHSPRINALKKTAQEFEAAADAFAMAFGASEGDILYGDIDDVEDAVHSQAESRIITPERAGYTSRYERACKTCPGCCECDEDCDFAYVCPDIEAHKTDCAEKTPVSDNIAFALYLTLLPDEWLDGFAQFKAYLNEQRKYTPDHNKE